MSEQHTVTAQRSVWQVLSVAEMDELRAENAGLRTENARLLDVVDQLKLSMPWQEGDEV